MDKVSGGRASVIRGLGEDGMEDRAATAGPIAAFPSGSLVPF